MAVQPEPQPTLLQLALQEWAAEKDPAFFDDEDLFEFDVWGLLNLMGQFGSNLGIFALLRGCRPPDPPPYSGGLPPPKPRGGLPPPRPTRSTAGVPLKSRVSGFPNSTSHQALMLEIRSVSKPELAILIQNTLRTMYVASTGVHPSKGL